MMQKLRMRTGSMDASDVEGRGTWLISSLVFWLSSHGFHRLAQDWATPCGSSADCLARSRTMTNPRLSGQSVAESWNLGEAWLRSIPDSTSSLPVHLYRPQRPLDAF